MDSKLILVTGDPLCDHNYYRGCRPTADASESPGFRVAVKGGGALLLADLIDQVMKAGAAASGWQTAFGLDPDYQSLPPHCHAFCLWEPQLSNPWEPDAKKQFKVWRAVEPPLGYGHPDGQPLSPEASSKNTCAITPRQQPLPARPAIVVINDAGLSFRTPVAEACWPFGADVKPSWVILKLTGPIGQNKLWETTVAQAPDTLVVIVSAHQLRRGNIRISKGLSWESTAEDLTAELSGNPALRPLLSARHLIVTFGPDAAFWLDNRPQNQSARLVFDAALAEGEWADRQGQGNVFGALACLTAALVAELCRSAEGTAGPDFEAAVTSGLGAARELRRLGHGRVTLTKKNAAGKDQEVDNPALGFPFAEIAAKIHSPTDTFVSALIPLKPVARGEWMMLDEWQVHARGSARQRPHFEAAVAVATLGADALHRFPVASFGDLQTVDRQEIESLRTLRQLISAYEKTRTQKKPLSLGVFGPPGAGKSFGVTQIAKAVLGDKVEILTFNLSQFSSTADLNGAFHQVRDKVLSGNTPVVFWDEFDAQGYLWLQYLLAPMQDGVFQDGQLSHPIGKCVFIFAGATSPTFEAFGPRNPAAMQPAEVNGLAADHRRDMAEKWTEFVLKKGPDFRSRLVGYLNVLGPNRRQKCIEQDGQRIWQEDDEDLCCPIRRALFIRGQFKKKGDARLNLDPGVLYALLHLSRYKSGARSLEFLCQSLQQNASGCPSRSCLPGRQLLDMHVDAAEFWDLCEQEMKYVPMSLDLAAALHEGYRLGIKGDPDKIALDVPFQQLPVDKQKANLAQALRIPANLSLLGLTLTEGPRVAPEDLPANRTPAERPIREMLSQPDHLELLSEAEHNGWMVERMLEGWKFSRRPDERNKRHPLLIPYSQLAEADKDLDRHTIVGNLAPTGRPQDERVGYVDIVKIAGLRVVKSS